MTCFEFRKRLLVEPRVLTSEQERHVSECAACAKAAADAASADIRHAQNVFVPVPDALADRVLLQYRGGRSRRYGAWAMAAALMIGVGLGTQLYRASGVNGEEPTHASALSQTHPAVAAISFVLEHEPRLLEQNRSGDPRVMRAAFDRLGLREPAAQATIRYLGKCPVPGGTGEHVVLTTAHGQVTLILVPDYPVGSRVLVADRRMVALANPAGGGGYIVVAQSAEAVKRVERMLKS